jgi:HK97 family phage prohead protease
VQIERRFNPNQPRDPDGQWSDGVPGDGRLPGTERKLRAQDGATVAVSYSDGRITVRFPDATDTQGGESGRGVVDIDRVTLDQEHTGNFVEDLEFADDEARDHGAKVRAASKAVDRETRGTPEHDAAMDRWRQLVDRRVVGGRFPADQGDLEYELFAGDDDELSFYLAIRPPDADDDWSPQDAAADGAGVILTPAQWRKFRREVEAMAGTGTRSRTSAYTHPRTPPRPAATARATTPRRGPAVGMYHRSFALDDIQISRSGDGRTVEAYAAMFDQPYEVRDQHGHYHERIDRAAFNRTLNGAGANAMCLYNHGMNVHGSPDGMASIPLGKPLEIRADGRGLLTVTRYNKGPFADQVLEAIRNGDITAQSFRGRIVRSSPNGPVPRRRTSGDLPTVVRLELGLTDYGPTPIPVNAGAEIVAVRSLADILDYVQDLDEDERAELLRGLGVTLDDTTPDTDPGDEDEERPDEGATATPDDSGPGAEDPPPTAALRSAAEIRRRGRVAMLTRGML